MSQDLADDSDLDSPLLSEDGDDTMSSHHSQARATAGATLNGESIDLRHLFPGGANKSSIAQEDHNDYATEEESQPIPPNAPSPTLTLSLDNQSSITSTSPSTLEYMKQTILFLPKKGRSFYYKTRYNVASFISSRSSTANGGLTPVDTTSGSSSNNNDSSFNNSNTEDISDNINTSNASRDKRRRNQITQKSSLWSAQSTPLLLKLLIPPLLITNHVLFYHAQTKPMWNLAYKTNVTISATASTLKAKAAADALNVPHHYEFEHRESKVVETFTYMDAIRKLWEGEGLGDAQTISKVAAALLVVFSGIWPHLKLLLVHVCWFFPFVHGLWLRRGGNEDDDNDDDEKCGCCNKGCCTTNNGSCNATTHRTKSRCSPCCSNGHSHQTQTLRYPFLRTLSTLGKWSLADVLVVCILIAVLHLDWNVNPDAIRKGIEKELPTLLDYAKEKFPDEVQDCTQLLKYTCGRHALVIHFPACLACQGLIKNAYNHPEWTANEGKEILEGIELDGGGYAQLRVMDWGRMKCQFWVRFAGWVKTTFLRHPSKCKHSAVYSGLDHPEWTANEGKEILEGIELDGGGYARLRVMGMIGTYYFCAAVIMSIVLSLIVDLLDERDRGCVEEDLLDRKRELEFILPGENGGLGNELELREETSAPQPLLNEALMLDDPSSRNQMSAASSRVEAPYTRLASNSGHSYIPSPTTNCYLLKQAVLVLLSISSLPLVCYAVTLPTMQRQVYGGGPTLLHQVLGMIWEKEYSLISLVKTTGDAGGWDYFLMLTFGLFAVVGPILRSVCLILHVLMGLPVALLGDCMERPRQRTTLRMVMYQATSTFRRALLPIIDALGAFGCWEVLIVALIMIQLEMPSITDTIYQDDRCQEADPEHGPTCIEVQFNALDNFLVVGIAWVVLTAASALAMDVAGDSEEKSHNSVGQDEKRYEFGQPIPLRRSNLNRSRAWIGSTGDESQSGGAGNDNDDGDEYYSPLQQQEEGGGDNGLEQIVFV
eukprot:CAMPEP_0172328038 /NCGR_PEP_ID=MMETSP1058-20130122/60141_1 /TAXON_ID=83371 /ORGANISM="Detonula confervacea, Strain CCMP 353" /LENGTH=995 /DNA_ID=CAMNT_0013045135 /DNA_START=204 /DNA_END=3191 /DNA_ORIENTATION=-